MKRGCRAGLLTATVTALAVIAACTPTDPSPTPTTTSVQSPTSSDEPTQPPTSPSPTTDAEVGQQRAEALIPEYYAVVDKLAADPAKPLDGLDAVTISLERESWTHELETLREAGTTVTGATRLLAVETRSVNMDNSDPAHGVVPTVAIDVCWDVSDVAVVDSTGAIITPEDRPARGWTRHLVSNYEWALSPTDAWRVASSEDLDRAPCDAD